MTADEQVRPDRAQDEDEGLDVSLPADGGLEGPGRRRFLGYVLAGATLVTAADLVAGGTPAHAKIPSLPQPAELYDLNDLITDAARPTANLISITINRDGTASFALPRSENGQGIVDSTAMLIAEELDLPVSKVKVTLADARPELLFNQLTGGSTTTTSTFTPIRVAAAIAKGALLDAAAIVLGDTVALLQSKGGVITAPSGRSVTYGELATRAASGRDRQVAVDLKSSGYRVIGTPVKRSDARAAVTGRKKYTLDLKVPGALPTMVCRPPSLNGEPISVRNLRAVRRMPGVTHVVQIDTGVAVRARTFGQCIDAIRALEVQWKDGPVVGDSDGDIRTKLRAAQLPFVVPRVDVLASTVEHEFTFWFKGNSALEPNAAIADVRADRAEIWSGLKNPIIAQQEIAQAVGLPQDAVKVHVIQGGGSFGRKLFFDGALEAAKISKAMGVPVKLMWHRADDTRQGRVHPMAVSRTRATYLGGNVLSFEQRHASVSTDYRHGLGEILSATAAKLPFGGNYSFAQSIYLLTQELGYDFGVVDSLLNEVDERFNTGSMRNIYSPDTRTAIELTVEDRARKMKKDPYEFRREFAKNARTKAVLDAVAKAANWGKTMAPGTAQGIAIHREYKGVTACVVELDCRPRTVNRRIREARTGPRVMRATFAVDAGLVINPNHLEAQMQGGMMDGIALALTSSLHLRNGRFLEASWDNYAYTRQWNVPPKMKVVIVDSGVDQPGGAGEAGVAATCAAVATAYWRATGTMPKEFPINHQQALHFRTKPFVPPVPQSPRNGLRFTF